MATRGRRKIPMKKIEDVTARNVTFAKRRSSLFRKASELCTLCAIEIVLVIFSPRGKPFVFGHPSAEDVIEKFLGSKRGFGSNHHQVNQANLKFLNERYSHVKEALDRERRRGTELKRLRRSDLSHPWVNTPVEELSPDEVAKQLALLTNLHARIEKRKQELLSGYSFPTQILPGMFDPTRSFANMSYMSFASPNMSFPTPSLSMSISTPSFFPIISPFLPSMDMVNRIPPLVNIAHPTSIPTVTPGNIIVEMVEPSQPANEKASPTIDSPKAKSNRGLSLDLNFPPPVEE